MSDYETCVKGCEEKGEMVKDCCALHLEELKYDERYFSKCSVCGGVSSFFYMMRCAKCKKDFCYDCDVDMEVCDCGEGVCCAECGVCHEES